MEVREVRAFHRSRVSAAPLARETHMHIQLPEASLRVAEGRITVLGLALQHLDATGTASAATAAGRCCDAGVQDRIENALPCSHSDALPAALEGHGHGSIGSRNRRRRKAFEAYPVVGNPRRPCRVPRSIDQPLGAADVEHSVGRDLFHQLRPGRVGGVGPRSRHAMRRPACIRDRPRTRPPCEIALRSAIRSGGHRHIVSGPWP